MDRREFLRVFLGGLIGITGFEDLLEKIDFWQISGKKGIIFLVGDGWPHSIIRATEFFFEKRFKEKSNLSFLANNPYSRLYLMKTNSLSSIVTDSAPASVAWGTGSKTINGSLASLPNGRKLKTIFQLAKEKGFSCGFVTTTRVTHATPAAWYSHNPNRNEEEKIALDLLNSKLDIILGGGQRYFSADQRKDQRDLYSEFRSRGYQVVKTKEELLKASVDKPILGVFNASHLSYFIDRVNDQNLGAQEPSLPEMTAIALSLLSRNPQGFVLQIEAGRIDHACHANDAYGAIMDAYELDKTLGIVNTFIKNNPKVLVIVTSDHGNSAFGINGTGPSYNDATEAILKYKNRASFEYIIKKMKGQDLQTVKEIFELYTEQAISMEEAAEIYQHLLEKKKVIKDDIWYEPQATMGFILRKSIYEGEKPKELPRLRRGNIGFTSTNHTAEDQIALIYSPSSSILLQGTFIDNTDLFKVMTNYLSLKYTNPQMSPEEVSPYLKPISFSEWKHYFEFHIT